MQASAAVHAKGVFVKTELYARYWYLQPPDLDDGTRNPRLVAIQTAVAERAAEMVRFHPIQRTPSRGGEPSPMTEVVART